MEAVKALSADEIYIIVTGIIMGTLARLITMKVDFRQIPSYPSAYFNNIIFGFIASALGAIAIPAILGRDYVAVTFLTVAVSQFREVKTSERESLGKLEHTEYVKRGEAYIDGIAKTFESRNYVSLVTALSTVLAMVIANTTELIINEVIGITTGFIVLFICYRFTKGKNVGYICSVKIGKIDVRGSEIYVDDMFLTNCLGTDQSRHLFITEGIAAVIKPRDPMCRVTLENFGQRQAIIFEAVRSLGLKRYIFMERNFPTGDVLIAFVPIINDEKKLLQAIAKTPVLENSRKIKRVMKTSFGG